MKKLVIIGGMGNGTVVASTVEDINTQRPTWQILGFLNDRGGEPINGYPVVGPITREGVAGLLADPDVYFCYTLLSTKLNFTFLPRLLALGIPLDRFATVIHPTAVVSKFAAIGRGVAIQPLVVVGPNVVIGNHSLIFAQALIGHNSTLGDYSYVANNACVGADVTLEQGAYLGTNCTLREHVRIGTWALVGMGAAVLNDVAPYSKVVGNPARSIGWVAGAPGTQTSGGAQ